MLMSGIEIWEFRPIGVDNVVVVVQTKVIDRHVGCVLIAKFA